MAARGACRPAARAALERSHQEADREVQRLLGRGARVLALVLVMLPVVWIGFGGGSPEHLLADHHTAVGERLVVDLPDGSRLVLDSATAVAVEYRADRRGIRLLDGRVFIDVASDTDRPLEIVTAEASATALGTSFSMQRLRGATHGKAVEVSVHESVVRVCPAENVDRCRALHAGEKVVATRDSVAVLNTLAATVEPGWVRGHLELDDRPLVEVLQELGRYHRGVLQVDDAALAGLTVSGVLPLDDIDRALHALASSQPIEVRRYTPWVIQVNRHP